MESTAIQHPSSPLRDQFSAHCNGAEHPSFSLFGWLPLWQRIAIRLLMLPLVAGLSYEVIRLTARSSLPLLRLLSLPGLWLQKLTTSEPDNGQVEVALCALKAVVDPDL